MHEGVVSCSNNILYWATVTKNSAAPTCQRYPFYFFGRSVVNIDRPTSVFVGGDLFLQRSHKSDAPPAISRYLYDRTIGDQELISRCYAGVLLPTPSRLLPQKTLPMSELVAGYSTIRCEVVGE